MKIYIQHNDGEPIFPIGFDEIADCITPEDWCEVDKHSYELEMDSEHKVYLSFATVDVNHDKCARDLEFAIKCVLDNIYGGKPFPNNNDNQ